MGPVATGLGEVYHYLLTSEPVNQLDRSCRTLQDWVIRPRLRRVPGVAEINAWGGLEKQFEAQVEPSKARQARAHARRRDAGPPRQNNQNVGRRLRHPPGESSLVQGVGRTTSVEHDRRHRDRVS